MESQEIPRPVMSDLQQIAADLAPKSKLWTPIGMAPHFASIFMLVSTILFAFANSLHDSGFALDNKFIILEDPRLREANQTNIKRIFQEDYWWPKAVSGLYRPLTTLSYLFNYSVLGNQDKAAGYHWVNFALHWLTAVLVYFCVMALMDKLWPALFAAA